jgi:hypothetical protein
VSQMVPHDRPTREELLALIERQVADGTLVIRQMTPAEREFWGPPKNRKRRKVA